MKARQTAAQRKPAARPLPVILKALAHVGTLGRGTPGPNYFNEIAGIYSMMPAFMEAVREGRVDGMAPTESIEGIAQVFRDLRAAQNDFVRESRASVVNALDGADLDADAELCSIETSAINTGFFIGLAFAYDALKGGGL